MQIQKSIYNNYLRGLVPTGLPGPVLYYNLIIISFIIIRAEFDLNLVLIIKINLI